MLESASEALFGDIDFIVFIWITKSETFKQNIITHPQSGRPEPQALRTNVLAMANVYHT